MTPAKDIDRAVLVDRLRHAAQYADVSRLALQEALRIVEEWRDEQEEASEDA